MWIFILMVVAIIVSIVYLTSNRDNYDWDSYWKFPGPKTVPIFGNMLELMVDPVDYNANLARLANEHGKAISLKQLHRPYLLVTGARQVESILKSSVNLKKGLDYNFFESLVGTNGMLTSTGRLWKTHRKLLTKSFHFGVVSQFSDSVGRYSTEVIDKIIFDGRMDVSRTMRHMALDNLCDFLLDEPLRSVFNSSHSYIESVNEATSLIFWRMINPFFWSDLMFSFHPKKSDLDRHLKVVNQFIDGIIRRHKERFIMSTSTTTGDHNSIDISDKNDNNGNGGNKSTLVEILIRNGLEELKDKGFNEMSKADQIEAQNQLDIELRDELNTFIFAGHDTTSSALTFFIYILARRPDIVQRIRKEIDLVRDGSDVQIPLTYEQQSRLRYLDCCIRESLRLFPPVPMINRIIHDEIKIDGKRVPPGTTVSIFIHKIQRDPEFFPNPNEYTPDRWLGQRVNIEAAVGKQSDNSGDDETVPTATNNILPYAHIPFSAGPRNCIGQRFANASIKSFISALVERCDFRLDEATLQLEKTHFKSGQPSSEGYLPTFPEVVDKPLYNISVTVEKRASS